MRFNVCNLLGRLCNSYQFDDGSIIKRTTRESLSYERAGRTIQIEFLYNGAGGYEYYLPKRLDEVIRAELMEKMDEYCARKGKKVTKCG